MTAHAPGRLAIVLHSHMPYVEGFGTWPFGEEWLFEAMATSYLPLLDVLERTGAPVTVSLTPVLCDQLEAAGVRERFEAFLRDVRPATHAADIAEAQSPAVADALKASAGDYAWAAGRSAALGSGGLLAALAPHAAWTSSATHAILPLLATDNGVRLQLQAGIDGHRARFDAVRPWAGGFWLPECAHAPWLEPLLEQAAVHATCVDLTDVLGRGAPEQLRPIATEAGPLLVPIDREVIELVWSGRGYPASGAYRDYHHHTTSDHCPWANDGTVYDRGRAAQQARDDAADFVARARARVAQGGLCVCALDTELLGHWWFEGPAWLEAVVGEAARQGLEVVGLDEALADPAALDPAPPRELPTTTWGTPRDLSTWEGPRVAELTWRAREAELRVVAAGTRVTPRAARELLALQSSDWAFVVTRDLASPYGRERAAGHLAALTAALGHPDAEPGLRNLAPYVTTAPLVTA